MTKINNAALIVIDVQDGFLDEYWGATTNHPGCETNIERLLEAWTRRGLPVVLVRHDSLSETSPLHPARPGNALMAPVAAVTPDLFVAKTVNSAFLGTPDLAGWLRAAGIESIVLCGIQTNMCVETTARMGGNLGFDVTVPIDATRTFDLIALDGTTLSAATLMQVTAANLARGWFAHITTTNELLSELANQ